MVKIIQIFATIILINSIPVILFLNSKTYYYKEFDKFEVYEEFNEDKELVKDNFDQTIEYINLRRTSINIDFFSKEDQIHLKDVRTIVGIYYFLVFVSMIIFIFSILKKKISLALLGKAAIVNLALYIFLGLAMIINFDLSFRIFHELLFRNDYWLLDPTTSNLIKYFPQKVFQRIGVLIFVFDIIISLLLIIIWILKIKKFSFVVDTLLQRGSLQKNYKKTGIQI